MTLTVLDKQVYNNKTYLKNIFSNIKRMKQQLKDLGFSFDWNRVSVIHY